MVNIWALDKHQDILHVLLLTAQLGSDAFVVDTESQQGARAVYLLHPTDPHLRIWLNTLGQAPSITGCMSSTSTRTTSITTKARA